MAHAQIQSVSQNKGPRSSLSPPYRVAQLLYLKYYLKCEVLHSRLRRAHQRYHFALGRAVFMHDLMAFRNLIEAERLREARIDLAVDDQLIERVGLFVVGEMR